MLSKSKQTKLSSIMNNGTPFVFLPGKDSPGSARIYVNSESRGYSTGYHHRNFFYLVSFIHQTPRNIIGLGNNHQVKTMRQYWETQGIDYTITDNHLWHELTGETL